MTYRSKLICAAMALCILLCGCANSASGKKDDPAQGQQDGQPQQEQTAQQPQTQPEPQPVEIRLVAAGDDLLHNTLSMDCEQAGGGYDFTHLYQNVSKVIQGSDIAFVNQEVMLTGEVGAYPCLSAPAEAADALIAAGFNVINLATNHSLDKGVSGLEACLENVHQRSFDAVLGAFRTQEEADAVSIVEKQGVKFGFLSYTYGLNGYSLPADRSYMISLIDEEKIQADLAALRPQCDYLVVSMHWGNEYQLTPSDYQQQLAQLLCDNGADLIIGTHPHVLEPVQWLESDDGHRTLCAYSLGNFISGQHKSATMLGGILELKLKFDASGALLETQSAGVIPTVTHYAEKGGGYTVYPLSEYTDQQAAEHGIKKYESPMTLKYLTDLSQQVLGDFAIPWVGGHD